MPGDWMLHCHLPHHMMNQMVSMVGPLSHVGHGMHTGMSMENGMGMLRDGDALAEDFGPCFRQRYWRERPTGANSHSLGGLACCGPAATETRHSLGKGTTAGHQGHAMPGQVGDVMYPWMIHRRNRCLAILRTCGWICRTGYLTKRSFTDCGPPGIAP